MITDEEILQLIAAEFAAKTLGVTEQYLEIHEPVYENGQIKIDRIDREKEPELVIAYLPVKGEYFYFAIYIDPVKKEIYNMGTEARNIISLRAFSDQLTSKQLSSFTLHRPSEYWDKGDLRKHKKSVYDDSFIEITQNNEPDKFEDKFEKFLVFLQEDEEGIIKLVANSDAYISIVMDFHYGNQVLGTAYLNLKNIQILNKLNLTIRFDWFAWGTPFK